MTKKKEDEKLKSIKEITDDVIDFAIDGMYSEIEENWDEDGQTIDITLSPKPELYSKLNAYFSELYVESAIDDVKESLQSTEIENFREVI